jgi:hypothetical protein
VCCIGVACHIYLFHGLGYPFIRGCAVHSVQCKPVCGALLGRGTLTLASDSPPGAPAVSKVHPSVQGAWTTFYSAVRAAVEPGGSQALAPVQPDSVRETLVVMEAARASAAADGRRM